MKFIERIENGIKLFDKIELWYCPGSWFRPDEWVFVINRSCKSGCVIIDIAWFGITWLRGGCSGDVSITNEKEE